MILVDTSVWVDHFRFGDVDLAELLDRGDVACHPFVVGELACGSLKNRGEILQLLSHLPQLPMAAHEEALALIQSRRLMGKGIGWIDIHLLASALLAGVALWTRDRRLDAAARSAGVRALGEPRP